MSAEPPEPAQWVMNMTLRQILDLFRRYSLGETPPVHPAWHHTLGMRHPLHPDGPGPDESYPDRQASQPLSYATPDRPWRAEESGPDVPPWSPPEGGITEGETLGLPNMRPWRAAPPWERPYSPASSDVPYTPDSSLGLLSEMSDSLTRRLNKSGQSSLGIMSSGGMPSPFRSAGQSSAGPSRHATSSPRYDLSFKTTSSSRLQNPYQSSEQISVGILPSSKSPSARPPNVHSSFRGLPPSRPSSPYQSDQSSVGVLSKMDDSFPSQGGSPFLPPGQSTPHSSRARSPYPPSDQSSLGLLPGADDSYSRRHQGADDSFGMTSYVHVSLSATAHSSTHLAQSDESRGPSYNYSGREKSPTRRDKSPKGTHQSLKGFSASRQGSPSPPSDESRSPKAPTKREQSPCPPSGKSPLPVQTSVREKSPCPPSHTLHEPLAPTKREQSPSPTSGKSPLPVQTSSRDQSPCPPSHTSHPPAASARREKSPCQPYHTSHAPVAPTKREQSPCPPSDKSPLPVQSFVREKSPCPPSHTSHPPAASTRREKSPCSPYHTSHVPVAPTKREQSLCPPSDKSFLPLQSSSRDQSPCPPSYTLHSPVASTRIEQSPFPPSAKSLSGPTSSKQGSPCSPSQQSNIGISPSSKEESPCPPYKPPGENASNSGRKSPFYSPDQSPTEESSPRRHKSPCLSSDKTQRKMQHRSRHGSPSPHAHEYTSPVHSKVHASPFPPKQSSPGAKIRMNDSFSSRGHSTSESFGILSKLNDSLTAIGNLMEEIAHVPSNPGSADHDSSWETCSGELDNSSVGHRSRAADRRARPQAVSSHLSQLGEIKNAVNHVLQQMTQSPPSSNTPPKVQSPVGPSGDEIMTEEEFHEWVLEDAQLKEEERQLEQTIQAHRKEWGPEEEVTLPPWGQHRAAPRGGVVAGDTMGGLLDRPIVATPPWKRYPTYESPESPDPDRYWKNLANKPFSPPSDYSDIVKDPLTHELLTRGLSGTVHPPGYGVPGYYDSPCGSQRPPPAPPLPSPPVPVRGMPQRQRSAPTTQMNEEVRYNYYRMLEARNRRERDDLFTRIYQKTGRLPLDSFHRRPQSAPRSERSLSPQRAAQPSYSPSPAMRQRRPRSAPEDGSRCETQASRLPPPPPPPLPSEVEPREPGSMPMEEQLRFRRRDMINEAYNRTGQVPQYITPTEVKYYQTKGHGAPLPSFLPQSRFKLLRKTQSQSSPSQQQMTPHASHTQPSGAYGVSARGPRSVPEDKRSCCTQTITTVPPQPPPIPPSGTYATPAKRPRSAPDPDRGCGTSSPTTAPPQQAPSHRVCDAYNPSTLPAHTQPSMTPEAHSTGTPNRSVRFMQDLEQSSIIYPQTIFSPESPELRTLPPPRYYTRPPQPDRYAHLSDEQKLARFGTVGPRYPRTASTSRPLSAESSILERSQATGGRPEWSSSPIPAPDSSSRLRWSPSATSTPIRAARRAPSAVRSRSASRGRGPSQLDPTRSETYKLDAELLLEQHVIDADERIRRLESDLIEDSKGEAGQFLYPYMSPEAKEVFLRSLGKINCALTRLKEIIKRRSERSYSTHLSNYELQGGQAGCPTSVTI